MRTTSFSGVAKSPNGYSSRRLYLRVKGSWREVRRARERVGLDAVLVEEVFVKGDPIVDAFDQGLQTLVLKLPEVLPAHALVLAVEDHRSFPLCGAICGANPAHICPAMVARDCASSVSGGAARGRFARYWRRWEYPSPNAPHRPRAAPLPSNQGRRLVLRTSGEVFGAANLTVSRPRRSPPIRHRSCFALGGVFGAANLTVSRPVRSLLAPMGVPIAKCSSPASGRAAPLQSGTRLVLRTSGRASVPPTSP